MVRMQACANNASIILDIIKYQAQRGKIFKGHVVMISYIATYSIAIIAII